MIQKKKKSNFKEFFENKLLNSKEISSKKDEEGVFEFSLFKAKKLKNSDKTMTIFSSKDKKFIGEQEEEEIYYKKLSLKKEKNEKKLRINFLDKIKKKVSNDNIQKIIPKKKKENLFKFSTQLAINDLTLIKAEEKNISKNDKKLKLILNDCFKNKQNQKVIHYIPTEVNKMISSEKSSDFLKNIKNNISTINTNNSMNNSYMRNNSIINQSNKTDKFNSRINILPLKYCSDILRTEEKKEKKKKFIFFKRKSFKIRKFN